VHVIPVSFDAESFVEDGERRSPQTVEVGCWQQCNNILRYASVPKVSAAVLI
jgi:hypothetical protein